MRPIDFSSALEFLGRFADGVAVVKTNDRLTHRGDRTGGLVYASLNARSHASVAGNCVSLKDLAMSFHFDCGTDSS